MRNFQTTQINSVNEIDQVFYNTMSPKKHLKKDEELSKIEVLDEKSYIDKKCHVEDDKEEMRVFNEIKKQFKIVPFFI